jgi:hypothetical protein
MRLSSTRKIGWVTYVIIKSPVFISVAVVDLPRVHGGDRRVSASP